MIVHRHHYHLLGAQVQRINTQRGFFIYKYTMHHLLWGNNFSMNIFVYSGGSKERWGRAHFWAIFSSIFMQSSGNIGQIVGWRLPQALVPLSGKSWIRHWFSQFVWAVPLKHSASLEKPTWSDHFHKILIISKRRNLQYSLEAILISCVTSGLMKQTLSENSLYLTRSKYLKWQNKNQIKLFVF